MKGLKAFALAVLLSGTASGQMMGGVISTDGYFPLVDGARYDYVHAGGPWASSTAVVRGGQAWAGVSGLYAMHTTYTCAIGVACAPDATDFYGQGPSGVHYYGGTGADAAGARFSMMGLTTPDRILDNPVRYGTMMTGAPGGYANAGSWMAEVHGTGSMMGTVAYTSRYSALALETVTTPAGTFANALRVREQRGTGAERDVWYAPGVGIVMTVEGGHVMRLSGYAMPGPVAQPGGGAAVMPFVPFAGLWWNPDESGTGYHLQVQRGVMTMTMLSYTPAGDPVWYYGPGPLVRDGSGIRVSGTLDRYRGGQCASCAYLPATVAGNDGAFTLEFDSPASATLRLPGGRVTRIRPMGW